MEGGAVRIPTHPIHLTVRHPSITNAILPFLCQKVLIQKAPVRMSWMISQSDLYQNTMVCPQGTPGTSHWWVYNWLSLIVAYSLYSQLLSQSRLVCFEVYTVSSYHTQHGCVSKYNLFVYGIFHVWLHEYSYCHVNNYW